MSYILPSRHFLSNLFLSVWITENMTKYGTIPTEAHPSSDSQIISNIKGRISSTLATTRSWKEIIQPQSLCLPTTFIEYGRRIKMNAGYFRMNYVIIILFLLFLILLWHFISLIVLIATMTAWLFLYLVQDYPLMISSPCHLRWCYHDFLVGVQKFWWSDHCGSWNWFWINNLVPYWRC